MPRLVMKFGGTSVADLERIRNVALKVKREVDRGFEVAVVVSSIGRANSRRCTTRASTTRSSPPANR
jgi:aspartate kinase